MDKALDALGQEINVGDVIAYSVRGGSWMSLRTSIVTAVGFEPAHTYSPTLVPVLSITGVSKPFRAEDCRHAKTYKRQVTSFDTVIRLHPDQHNDDVRWLLEQVKREV